MIYLDNAATTWPKPACVRTAVERALSVYGANPGRGGHKMSMASAREVYRCRETAADFFHAPDESHVIFTANCTMALNMAIKGILKNGGRAVISSLEHNAVLRPLHALSPMRPVYDVARVVPGDDEATVEAFRACITRYTKVIICTHASNVFGVRLPIRRIGELARKNGLLFVVDAAQTAGICPIDMEKDGIDFLCLPGHKGLYGPMGTGMLICGNRFELPALLQGGTGSLSLQPDQPADLPDRLESGTLNVPGICGLQAGMAFVSFHGVEAIAQQEMEHTRFMYSRLEGREGIHLYTEKPTLETAVPLLAVNAGEKHSEETAAFLASYDIAVRAGLHCAPLAHRHFGTVEQGAVRLAPSVFTTRQEIERTCKILCQYVKIQSYPLQTKRNVVK